MTEGFHLEVTRHKVLTYVVPSRLGDKKYR